MPLVVYRVVSHVHHYQALLPELFSKLNISEEIQDLTANDIGQKLGTLGRHMGHWADIKNIR